MRIRFLRGILFPRERGQGETAPNVFAHWDHEPFFWLASADPHAVKLWDAATGQATLTLEGHTDWIVDMAFSPDGKRLVSASEGKTVKVWDIITCQETLTLKHDAGVIGVEFSSDGIRLVSPGRDGTVNVWDARPRSETFSAGAIVR